MTKVFVKAVSNKAKYDAEAISALGKQAKAWRIAAVILSHDQTNAANMVRALFLQTVPFTNGEWIDKFIAENEAYAEECGRKSGVFS